MTLARPPTSAGTAVPPVRRGECPTLARPMQTGDGLLARLRPIGSAITIAEMAALAVAASRYGNGIVEITARGSIQVRGLRPETVSDFEAAVLAAGIRPETGTSVETPPLAGIDPTELVDTRPLAASLRRRIAEHVPPLRLAPKLAIVLDGGGRFHLDGVFADIRVRAFTRENGLKFMLAVGGTQETARPVAVVEAHEIEAAVLTVLQALSAEGPKARGKGLDLLSLGELYASSLAVPCLSDKTAPLIGIHSPPSVPSGHPPLKGGDWEIATPASHTSPANGMAQRLTPSSPQRGEEGDRRPRRNSICDCPDFEGEKPEGQRGVKSPSPSGDNAKCILGIAFPYCQASAEQLIALATAAESTGATEFRLAPDHGLFITGLTPKTAGQLQRTASTLGFLTEPDDLRRTIALCAGSRGCASGLYDTHALADLVCGAAPELLDGSFTLHLSGCSKGCAHPAASLVTVAGATSGHGLVVNGAASDIPLAYLDETGIKTAWKRLAALVEEERQSGESTGGCLKRLGPARIRAALQLEEK